MKKHTTREILGTIGLMAVTSLSAMAAPTYTFTNLGALPGGFDGSSGTSINTSGAVAGFSSNSGTAGTAPTSYTGVSDATKTGLGSLGGTTGQGNGINASGTIVGTSTTAGDTSSKAFIYTAANGIISLETFSGGSADNSYAQAINASGEVVGQAANANIAGSPGKAFLIKAPNTTTSLPTVAGKTPNPAMVDLGSLNGVSGNSIGYAINTNGTVVGTSDNAAGSAAFIWTPSSANGTTSVLGIQKIGNGTLGGTFGDAFGINDSGVVVGDAYLAGDLVNHAYYATAVGGVYTMTDIQNLGAQSLNPGGIGYATGVNNAGMAVGYVENTDFTNSRAFLYTPGGGMVDLNTLIAAGSGFTLTQANAINASGQITGFGVNGSGAQFAFLLNPIAATPEPAPMAVLLVGMMGLGGLALRARRRNVMSL